MALPRFLRDGIVRIAKQDVLNFLDEYEETLFHYFRDELEALDDRLDEEKVFIDIHMQPLGEELLRAVLRAVRRFIADFGADED